MRYKRVDHVRYIQGLPMQEELDEATLNQEGRELLKAAVSMGIYALIDEPPAIRIKKSEKVITHDEPSTQD